MKGVIPAAGLGTRFLPYTKSQAKEMLPLADKPTIQYVVEEAVASGIHDILLVTGRGKRAIEDHFDRHPELEARLRAQAGLGALKELEALLESVRIHYVRQGEPLGLGHAILTAEAHIGREPFACLLGDDVTKDTVPCTRQLREVHEARGTSVIAVQRIERERMSSYGMVVGKKIGDRLYRATDLVEKPSPSEIVSDLAVIGRYILTPGIFEELRGLSPSAKGEIQLTDALNSLCKREEVLAYEFHGRRYDLGSKVDWILANVEFGLADGEIGPELLKGLKALRGT